MSKRGINDNAKLVKDDLKWKRFINWIHTFDVDDSNVQLADFEDTGRGLILTKDIDFNTPIIKIPSKLLLNIQTIERFYNNSNFSNLSAHQLIAIHICLEKRKGENSYLKPYLDVLPDDFSTLPISWPEKISNLGPRCFQNKLLDQREIFNNDFQKCQEFVKNLKLELLTYDEFLYSWACVNTRCLYMADLSRNKKDNMTMCPLIDMVNHHSEAGTDVKIQNGKEFVFFTLEDKEYKKGSQIFLPYGQHDNIFLLIEYGFFIPNSPCSYVKVDNEVEELSRKYDLLESLLQLEDHGYLWDWTFDCEPSFRLLVVLRWLSMNLLFRKSGMKESQEKLCIVKGKKVHKVMRDITKLPKEQVRVFQQMLRGEKEIVNIENEEMTMKLLDELYESVENNAVIMQKRLNVNDMREKLIWMIFQEIRDLIEISRNKRKMGEQELSLSR